MRSLSKVFVSLSTRLLISMVESPESRNSMHCLELFRMAGVPTRTKCNKVGFSPRLKTSQMFHKGGRSLRDISALKGGLAWYMEEMLLELGEVSSLPMTSLSRGPTSLYPRRNP
jgi:hypothetical protein